MIYGSMAYHDFYDLSPYKNTLVMIPLRIHHTPFRQFFTHFATLYREIKLQDKSQTKIKFKTSTNRK